MTRWFCVIGVCFVALLGGVNTATAAPPALRCAIECDFGPAFEWLARARDPAAMKASWTATSGLARATRAIAAMRSEGVEQVEARIRGELESDLVFPTLAEPTLLARAERAIRAAVAATAIRREFIERRVSGLLPESSPYCVLPVVFVVGMQSGFTAQPFDEGGRRALLVDVLGFAEVVGAEREDLRDALGEELGLAISPELFFAAYAALEAQRGATVPRGDLERLQRTLLVEGVADHLGRSSDERYDGSRRHAPLIDAVARDAFAALEKHLLVILDPDTSEADRRERVITFSNGPREARYGVLAGSFMVDAIVRFSGSRRVAQILETGPQDLAWAYAEVCSGHAAVPRLGTRVTSILASDAR